MSKPFRWDLPPLQAVAPLRETVFKEEAELPTAEGSHQPRKTPSRRARTTTRDPPPAGTEWNQSVYTWFHKELAERSSLMGELRRYLGRPGRAPQTEESCLRAFYRRAGDIPLVALDLATDFLLMERWRDELQCESLRRGLRLVSRREDPAAARKKLRELVDPALRKASAKLQAGELLCDMHLHRDSTEYTRHVVDAAFWIMQKRSHNARADNGSDYGPGQLGRHGLTKSTSTPSHELTCTKKRTLEQDDCS